MRNKALVSVIMPLLNAERFIRRKPIGTTKAVFGVADMGSSKESALLDRILKLKDAVFPNFALLFAYLLIRNGEVPAHNELVYLLHLAKQWNPSFLSNDWTFAGPLPSHFVFNLLFGPLTLLFPLEIVGWLGRIFCWSLILLALIQVGKHFRIPLWMITLSILFWLFYGQSIVGGEWIFGPFEAKCIAYALLFFSLNGFMHQRGIIFPSILLGLAFSFHALVGFWGALAIGLSLVVLRYPTDVIIKFGCYTTLAALPGLIPLLTTPLDESTEAWRFVAFVVMPYHFDPFSFPPWKLFLLVILLCFNWLHFRSDKNNHALRFLMIFQVFFAVFFISGFFARFADNYVLLKLMPCRIFPVLLPLFFFFHLMSTLQHCSSIKSPTALVAGGFLALAMFGIPAKLTVNYVKALYREETRDEEDLKRAFQWVAKNTPPDSIVIVPPWRKDSFYLSQRAQIANWWVLRFDRLTEWRERLETLAGDLSSLTDGTEKANMTQTMRHYNGLAATDIASLVEKYGADYLVSSAKYSYPILFNSGTYKVYSLTNR
jgi:hypothetical protein